MLSRRLLDAGELEQVIAALPAQNRDLRSDPELQTLYYKIRDLRSRARDREREAIDQEQAQLIDASQWSELVEQAETVLKHHSKDLEIAAWMIEGLTRCHSFAGLAQGFQIAIGLIENHWNNLYPEPDEDGMASRVAPLVNLNGFNGNGTLLMPLQCLPLIEASQGGYCSWQFNKASQINRIADAKKRERKESELQVTIEQMKVAASQGGQEFFLKTQKDLEACLASYERLSRLLDQNCEQSLPSDAIRETLEACLAALRFLYPEALTENQETSKVVEENQQTEELAKAEEEVKIEVKPAASGNDRQAALQNLKNASAYFRRAEPHSPVSYLIEQAIRWSGLSLPELMKELIEDKNAQERFCQLTGIKNTN